MLFFLSDHERNSSYTNRKKNSDMYYQYFMHIFSINDKLHYKRLKLVDLILRHRFLTPVFLVTSK